MATPFYLPGPFGVLTDDQALPYLVRSEPYSARYQPVCGYRCLQLGYFLLGSSSGLTYLTPHGPTP
jgi:hypothetical protein